MDQYQFQQLKEDVVEIKISQQKVAEALLGSLNGSKGIIETQRELRDDVNQLQTHDKTNTEDIAALKKEKGENRKLVAGFVLALTVVFEVCRFIGGIVVDYFKIHK